MTTLPQTRPTRGGVAAAPTEWQIQRTEVSV
jgi:hypothetical protein